MTQTTPPSGAVDLGITLPSIGDEAVTILSQGNILKSHPGYVKGDLAGLDEFLTERLGD